MHSLARKESKVEFDARMKWWREARFGMFIHWGPVSLKGTEIGWSRGGERRGTSAKGKGAIPVEVYDNLYKQFNPVKFNAKEWVEIAKNAGMKYMVFTTKHHDGFSMFDSKLTEYKITNSPFKRDVCKELAEACHKAGLGLGWYYSPRDWYHPDFATKNHARYVAFYLGQLRELCTNYGKVDIIWFDGLDSPRDLWGDAPKKSFEMIRSLQPHIILNNRGGLPGDFTTPEQQIGPFNDKGHWETCMTLCRQWSWKPNDKMKSLKECLHTLVRVVGGDGNLLFNVGPMPDGRIEPRQVKRLLKMGQWLEEHGNSIYGTRGGSFKPGTWGASTHKRNRVYVHILNVPEKVLVLPTIPQKIVSSRLLSGAKVFVTQSNKAVEISVAKADTDPIDIVVLELNKPVSQSSR